VDDETWALLGVAPADPLQSLRASDDESVVLQDASQALWVWLPSWKPKNSQVLRSQIWVDRF